VHTHLNNIVIKISFLVMLIFGCQHSNETLLPMGDITYPMDNPSSVPVAELGRRLFFDTRLSPDNTVSCAHCHQPEKAFSDGNPTSEGFHGRRSTRNAPSLMNVGYHPYFMQDGGVATLEMQALVPLQDTAEMNNDIAELLVKLQGVSEYQQAAQKIFQRDFDAYVLTRALANFQRTLVSQNSPFDQWYYQDKEDAISEEAKKGFQLFSERLYCTTCHTLPAFTNYTFANNGHQPIYSDLGRYRISYDSLDNGKFKVPSLRNIILTAPYMHDGSIASLEEVVKIYAKGGAGHPNQDKRIKPFKLSDVELNYLIQFFETLTDLSTVKSLENN
jgi:cytochrome c peroxidase